MCPTCHCFDIVDEGYLRLRCWDTCSSSTFTRMAAGEDHRRQKESRYRQRIYHKFSYFEENFGTYACVGCGRCSRYCPVKIDIVEIVNGIVSGAHHGGGSQWPSIEAWLRDALVISWRIAQREEELSRVC